MAIRDDDFRNFVRGDEKAFEAIFNEYYKTLVSYSMRHGLEQMEAEDVVIEMFHHVWQIRQEIESPAALHTLLYTATRNRSLNVLRNLQNRKRLLEENYRPEEEEEPPAGEKKGGGLEGEAGILPLVLDRHVLRLEHRKTSWFAGMRVETCALLREGKD